MLWIIGLICLGTGVLIAGAAIDSHFSGKRYERAYAAFKAEVDPLVADLPELGQGRLDVSLQPMERRVCFLVQNSGISRRANINQGQDLSALSLRGGPLATQVLSTAPGPALWAELDALCDLVQIFSGSLECQVDALRLQEDPGHAARVVEAIEALRNHLAQGRAAIEARAAALIEGEGKESQRWSLLGELLLGHDERAATAVGLEAARRSTDSELASFAESLASRHRSERLAALARAPHFSLGQRKQALRQIADQRTQVADRCLREILQGADDAGLRSIAAHSLARRQDEEALQIFTALIEANEQSSVERSLLAQLAECLTAYGRQRATPPLLKLLDHPRASVAGSAADALAKVRSVEALPRLDALGKDTSSERLQQRVKEAAANIRELAPPELAGALTVEQSEDGQLSLPDTAAD